MIFCNICSSYFCKIWYSVFIVSNNFYKRL